jgi:hypothetical protein
VFADIHPKMRALVDEAGRQAVEMVSNSSTSDIEPADLIKQAARARDDAAKIARTHIADAYATAVMGPAYVWAAMLLRADPSSDSDDQRVAVMLQMMQAINEASEDTGNARAFKRAWAEIGDEWLAARGQVGGALGVAALSDDLSKLVDTVRQLVKVPFRATDWAQASLIADQLEKKAAPAEIARRLEIAHLRLVLAAAWIARVRLTKTPFVPAADAIQNKLPAQRSGFAEMQCARLGELAECTRAVCVAIIDADSKDPPRPDERASNPIVQPPSNPFAAKLHDLPLPSISDP